MNIEEIEIIIGKDGKIQLETSGFSGEGCLKATEELEALLGNRLISREQKSEIYAVTAGKTAEKLKITH